VGDIINASSKFAERNEELMQEMRWLETREKLREAMKVVAVAYGDDLKLIEKKTDALCDAMREITDREPNLDVQFVVPTNATPEQIEIFTRTVRNAAIQGYQSAMEHAVETIMMRAYDLITSKLASG
jgi:hypothetical protein